MSGFSGKNLVLLVDDTPANIQAVHNILKNDCTTRIASRLTGKSSPSAVRLPEEMVARLPGAAVLLRGAVELKRKGSVRMVDHPKNAAV